MKFLLALATAGLAMLCGCRSSPRFTHVDVEGPAPFVYFDQKTKQMCWAGSLAAATRDIPPGEIYQKDQNSGVTLDLSTATDLHGKPLALVAVQAGTDHHFIVVQMPLCKDLD